MQITYGQVVSVDDGVSAEVRLAVDNSDHTVTLCNTDTPIAAMDKVLLARTKVGSPFVILCRYTAPAERT